MFCLYQNCIIVDTLICALIHVWMLPIEVVPHIWLCLGTLSTLFTDKRPNWVGRRNYITCVHAQLKLRRWYGSENWSVTQSPITRETWQLMTCDQSTPITLLLQLLNTVSDASIAGPKNKQPGWSQVWFSFDCEYLRSRAWPWCGQKGRWVCD